MNRTREDGIIEISQQELKDRDNYYYCCGQTHAYYDLGRKLHQKAGKMFGACEYTKAYLLRALANWIEKLHQKSWQEQNKYRIDQSDGPQCSA
jgi:hypothetical protein